MKPKSFTIIYWILTGLFAISMLLDGISGVIRVDAGKESLQHLGYPMYLLTILGVAKILGAIAILQTKFVVIKEWAFAGFAITFIGAFASWAFVGDNLGFLIPPIIMLAVMFLVYFLWKKSFQL